jgi:hypothetical protein
MLGVSSYTQEYVDACRARVDETVATYERVAASADGAAVEAFQPRFYEHMVIALDAYFMHRLRKLEGKDGNALNEVRVLSASIMQGGGKLQPDPTIKLKPETSLLGLAAGDEIALGSDDFARLSAAFFGQIEERFAAGAAARA